MRQIFLDCDGVLADFDTTARQLFGQDSREAEAALGSDLFWNRISGCGDFYRNLPLIADARDLYKAVAHLNPIILTGCPEGGWSEPQKVAWAEHHFPSVKMITCRSKDKYLHITKPGDVLVDDYLRYRELWEAAGGIFVQHISAKEPFQRLVELRIPVRR
ncbi:MAG TPA: hypothetical protein VND90_14795 [Terracidiphilus sp.]|nr:hypothetical protein [Terracidiphilus sp.]